MLVEGIESHLLGFGFHKRGSLLAVPSNFGVLEEFAPAHLFISDLLVRNQDSASISAALCD